MATKKESKKNAEQRSSLLQNQFYFFEEMVKASNQIIKNQKELVNGTKEQIEQLEENSKQLITDWKTNTEKFLSENKELKGKEYQDYLNKLEVIGHKSQQIAYLPGKTSLDLLLKSTEQLEETFVNAAEQNKKIREEITNAFDNVFAQMKETQKEMYQFFSFNPIASK